MPPFPHLRPGQSQLLCGIAHPQALALVPHGYVLCVVGVRQHPWLFNRRRGMQPKTASDGTERPPGGQVLAACCGVSDGVNTSRRFHSPAKAFRVVCRAWLPQTELLRAAPDTPVGGHGLSFLVGVQEVVMSRHTLTCNVDTAKRFSTVAVPAETPAERMSVPVTPYSHQRL